MGRTVCSGVQKQAGTDMPACIRCGRILHPDEIGLTRKLVNRGAEEFLCISCLSARFGVPEETLREKIAQYREMGCTLFT